AIAERELHGIGLAPLDATRRANRGGLVEHRLIEVRGDDLCVLGKRGGERARHYAGAGGDLEHALHRAQSGTSSEVVCVRLENERNKIALIDLRDRSRENLVGRGFSHDGVNRMEPSGIIVLRPRAGVPRARRAYPRPATTSCTPWDSGSRS